MAATSPITPAPPLAKAAGQATSVGEGPAVVGLVLAAGGGRRLGGRPKALLDHGGRPLVERAVRAARAGGCAPAVHVVLGAAAERVRELADLAGCVVIDNPDWATGMGSSLRAGLASVRDATRGALGPDGPDEPDGPDRPDGPDGPSGSGASAVLLLLVDQPGVGAEAVARVVRAHRAGAGLVAAAYGGRRGHPVLFAREHWARVAALAHGDRGARDFLRAHAAELTLVECADIASCADIDTPADLRLLDPDG
ncbi:nucleotidyltransferase family protein [Streptomyces sp. 71268]|uniref:nucleotidyltransferase family protein n=1 Tax=Streptomyces sp. 71268 TaxID=3002640 RepID=UPI0023F65A56|nr:nucleotidyltransferase family protein [Streptomyces sp. 71268]WEV24737.1 nucleotidyltransferase family protein [Streptomyces sp. 71268]